MAETAKEKSSRSQTKSKTTTKRTPRKRAASKAAPQKRTTNGKKKTATKKKVTKKVTIIEPVVSSGTQPSASAPDPKLSAPFTTPPKPVLLPRPQLRQRATLLATSVARLPMQADRYGAAVARTAGVTLGILGALCSLLYAQQVWTPQVAFLGAHNMAATCTQCMDSATTSTTTTDTNTTSTATQLSVNQQPSATFAVDSPDPLSHKVTVTVTVADATAVNLLVDESSYTHVIPLGPMLPGRLSGTWTYVWDTTQYPDDSYKFAADIYNAYYANTPYRQDDLVYHTVSNATATTTTTTTTTATTTTTTTQSAPAINLSELSTNPVDLAAKFSIKVTGASLVQLYAQDSAGKNVNLGDAYVYAPGEWRFTWETQPVPNGSYTVNVLVQTSAGSFYSSPVTVDIKHPVNQVATTTSTTDTATTTTVLQSTQSATTSNSQTLPTATLSLPLGSSQLSGTVALQVKTTLADRIDVYAMPVGSTVAYYEGYAEPADSGLWVMHWNTLNTPNGYYTIYADVHNTYGVIKSNSVGVQVYNKPQAVPLTPSDETHIQQVTQAKQVADSLPADQTTTVTIAPPTSDRTQNNATTTDQIQTALLNYAPELDAALQRYAAAYRVQDQASMDRVQGQLDALHQQIVTALTASEFPQSDAAEINGLISKHIQNFIAQLPIVDKIIADRLGSDVFKDSDHDGISDYDEVNVYHTDPYSADTDGDGIPDGVEIMNGTDPLSSDKHGLIQYQLPQDNGVQRADLLAVTSIAAAPTTTPTTTSFGSSAPATTTRVNTSAGPETATPAVITGKGLPNSFVTLYIFSTPIVVTVKTSTDGSWQYRFDKELPDGKHTIYVGVTDNAGRIIAKSAPFNFVKSAYAYSPTTDSPVPTVAPQADSNSLLAQYLLYLVLSISVMAIGLVLILLGFHLENRKRQLAKVLPTETDL